MTAERILIILLLGLLVWFGFTIIRLEKYHYANQIGLCQEPYGAGDLFKKDKCLNEAETRTNPVLHLLYGLKIL